MLVRPRQQNLVLAHVVENDGTLVITQSNAPALRSVQNSLRRLLIGGLGFASVFGSGYFFGKIGRISPPTLFVVFFLLSILPLFWGFMRSINRFFGKETFVFDRNEGIFIRNSFKVGPLQDIRAVTAQVTRAEGQYPMFRLILEMPRCETVTLVRTHDVPAEGEFRISQNGFDDPNKRFAMFTPWLDYDEQDLVPFLPPEIVELRRIIREFIGEAARKEEAK